MASYLSARTAPQFDYCEDSDVPYRKSNTDDYTCSYPIFNTDHQKSFDMYRSYNPNQHGSNQFTFNHSITHVNLINNRLQIPNSSSYNSFQVPTDNMNLMTHFLDPYHKSDSLNRNFGHILNSYHLPAMVNNSLAAIESYPNSHGYPKISPVINFNINQSQIPPPLIGSNRIKSDEAFTSTFYSDTLGGISTNGLPMLHNVKVTELSENGKTSRDHDVDQADETQKCKNTIEGTKTSVRRFKRWYKERHHKELDMNSVNRFNAPELLKDFFLDIRDTRPGRVGNEYEPVTLTTYRNGLRRFFLYRKVPPAPDNFDLTDKGFDIVNRHLVTKRDDLKRKGKGNHPNAIESITPNQLEKMWASGAIGTHAPRPLLRLMWWYNTVYHGVRGRMAHHELTVDDFIMKRDIDGKVYMVYVKKNYVQDNINNNMEPPKKKKCKGLVKESDGGERDAIRAFEIFKAHRPPGIASFYLTPKTKPKGDIWFNKVPMGKNSIGRVMREIKAISAI
ncbi:uncharacterized protein LOC100212027 [Hydra vulgaris]|uniref:uncharacterized protein LOC100212027 n=1 Tax=Hydra vulgaris TaxID=6087 RepID=UPI0002B43512|nr:uncharacterized protein LOC100212027 [Hydra vulgaris]